MANCHSVLLGIGRRPMIDRREILEAATQTSLNPHVIEKDYVLGWMLAGIYAHDELAELWVFKGGTCLKKCFLETYRFSEDLDFTLRDATHLDPNFLKRVFAEIAAWIYEETGIEIPVDQQQFDVYQNPRGQLSCQGKISYKGPVSPTRPLPRIKLDLTADEHIVLPPATIEIFHPCSDAPAEASKCSPMIMSKRSPRNLEPWPSARAHVIYMMSSISTAIATPAPSSSSSSMCYGRSASLKAFRCLG
jgi:Nucleotidyl transferase AbiEii toxin, Type IV TA system